MKLLRFLEKYQIKRLTANQTSMVILPFCFVHQNNYEFKSIEVYYLKSIEKESLTKKKQQRILFFREISNKKVDS